MPSSVGARTTEFASATGIAVASIRVAWSKGCSGSSMPSSRRCPARQADPWRTATNIPQSDEPV